MSTYYEFFYRSYLPAPDGRLWCESKDPDEVRIRSKDMNCYYEKITVTITKESHKEEWDPQS